MVNNRIIFRTALLLILVLLVEISTPVFATSINLPVGTVVRLELAETVSSESAVIGQRVNFKVISKAIHFHLLFFPGPLDRGLRRRCGQDKTLPGPAPFH